MDINNILTIFASFVVALTTTLLLIQNKLGKVEGLIDGINRRQDDLNSRVTKVEDQQYNFLVNFVNGSNAKKHGVPESTQILLDKLDYILSRVKPNGNPISQDEINRVRAYRNKIAHGDFLSPEETKDMIQLLDKLKDELSTDEQKEEFDTIAAGILGFIGGLLIAALFSDRGDS